MVLVLAACGNGNGDGGGEEGSGEGGSESEGRVAELQEAGTVNVGFANEPPYAYQNSDSGELEGANIEIAKAVFQEMGIEEVNGHLTDWGELIPCPGRPV